MEDYRQSLIYETVTKGLDKTVPLKDSGVDWIGQIPEGWEITRLKYICGMQSGNNLTSLEISSENDGGKIFPVYGGNGQRGYYNDFTNEGNYCLVGRQGALAGNVHFVSGKFWATDHAIVVYEHTHTYSKYVYYLLKVMNLNQYAFETSAQPGLSVEKILQLETIHCPKGEQTQIADFLDKKTEQINQMIAIKKEQIENINKQRQTLIYDYVTGKRRV
ncbi:TPA: restriction endonuclease subunit S [Streptococcus suis]|nr:restriction endonuclease subunit S [Streptococcus suis]HEL1736634.1 restriction endonuclease subunit S [Streptococcus suis]HEL1772925.1 restriction endonuclease subunit S [Streptococcus suis]HEL1991237.1 restriction endonuclease subunit S [Streptococcus suis]HEL2139596.1 restriction endonuclease subunit S [Streptococcus suis]